VITRFFAACADLVWPRRCAGCDDGPPLVATPLCEECLATLAPVEPGAACARCAAPLRAPGPDCPDCRALPSCLSRVVAPYEYGGALADALVRLKWHERDDLARPLGRLLGPPLRRLVKAGAGFDLVAPVPLHPRRLRQRGFNQALLLAKAGAKAAGLGPRPLLAPTLLRRVRSDPPAREASRRARFLRTHAAFAVSSPRRVRGQRVLIVDDVVTTGATVAACATALFAAGATHVEALALLRAAP
jgi:ComF family protein